MLLNGKDDKLWNNSIKPDFSKPSVVITYAIAFAITIIPAAYAIKILVSALSVMIGLIYYTATTGVLALGAIGTLIAPFLAILLWIVCIILVVFIFKAIGDNTKKNPYSWTIPLLGVASGLLTNISIDVGNIKPLIKSLVSAITALWVVISGYIYPLRKGVKYKVIVGVFYLIPSLIILGYGLRGCSRNTLLAYLSSVTFNNWIVILAFVLFGGIIVVLSKYFKE